MHVIAKNISKFTITCKYHAQHFWENSRFNNYCNKNINNKSQYYHYIISPPGNDSF